MDDVKVVQHLLLPKRSQFLVPLHVYLVFIIILFRSKYNNKLEQRSAIFYLRHTWGLLAPSP